MADAAPYILELRNADLKALFVATSYDKRIGETIKNLQLQSREDEPLQVGYRGDNITEIYLGGSLLTASRSTAFFFENTNYQVQIQGAGVSQIRLSLNRVQAENINSDYTGSTAFGALSFKNQVGQTDILIRYCKGGEERQMSLSTEVLSYKLDYRSDLRLIIADIEREYSMLSYDFLKQTYLSFATKRGESTDLVWWQIFCSCYRQIIQAANTIIRQPRHRLHDTVIYERAERLSVIMQEIENDFVEHSHEPNYLYRTQQLSHTHDTLENRFFKFVMRELLVRYQMVAAHIRNSLQIDREAEWATEMESMGQELTRIANHPFFRGIGAFRGFSQDNLVMKKAHGYSDIYRCWIELQCGFDLYEGMRRLEVKDISDLYEIWCFIKVKNIVADILKDKAQPMQHDKSLSLQFIRQLQYGEDSEVKFISSDKVELASVMYNATSKTTEHSASPYSAIADTKSFTTEQRPDIVLRLTRHGDRMLYTYLFDAKYRINDCDINGQNVPPPDAINQLHRYRDAIYYEDNYAADVSHSRLKKEVIGGYVLFPGTMTNQEYQHSFYREAADRVGIGAFPLKPSSIDLSVDSTEAELRHQIEAWLQQETYPSEHILQSAIPQKGLAYTDQDTAEPVFFISSIDGSATNDKAAILNGTAQAFFSGYSGTGTDVDYLRVHYLAPIDNHLCRGYYDIVRVHIVDLGNKVEKPMRIKFVLGAYHPLPQPINYGVDRMAAKGTVLPRTQFFERIVHP